MTSVSPTSCRALLGGTKGSNCRHEYGLQFMRITGQTACAYCHMPFLTSYENWLQMALDHVVPTKTGLAKGIPSEWLDDCSSKVLACAACNTYQNRYKLDEDEVCPMTLDEYYNLRDRVFLARAAKVQVSHEQERAFFERKVKVGLE